MRNGKLLTISLAALLYSTSATAQYNEDISFDNRLVDAVNSNNLNIVEAILSTGENPNQAGKFETSPLHRAAVNGNPVIAKLLIENGADVNIRDYGGATPLHVAARVGEIEFAKLLLENNAELNAQDAQGFTPLHRAIVNKQVPVSIYFIKSGADVNTLNNDGNTPIIDAVRNSQPAILKELIVAGADKSVRNNKGQDAIDFAIKNANPEMDFLLSVKPSQLVETDNTIPNFLKEEAKTTAKKIPPSQKAFNDPSFTNIASDTIKVPIENIIAEDIDRLTPVTVTTVETYTMPESMIAKSKRKVKAAKPIIQTIELPTEVEQPAPQVEAPLVPAPRIQTIEPVVIPEPIPVAPEVTKPIVQTIEPALIPAPRIETIAPPVQEIAPAAVPVEQIAEPKNIEPTPAPIVPAKEWIPVKPVPVEPAPAKAEEETTIDPLAALPVPIEPTAAPKPVEVAKPEVKKESKIKPEKKGKKKKSEEEKAAGAVEPIALPKLQFIDIPMQIEEEHVKEGKVNFDSSKDLKKGKEEVIKLPKLEAAEKPKIERPKIKLVKKPEKLEMPEEVKPEEPKAEIVKVEPAVVSIPAKEAPASMKTKETEVVPVAPVAMFTFKEDMFTKDADDLMSEAPLEPIDNTKPADAETKPVDDLQVTSTDRPATEDLLEAPEPVAPIAPVAAEPTIKVVDAPVKPINEPTTANILDTSGRKLETELLEKNVAEQTESVVPKSIVIKDAIKNKPAEEPAKTAAKKPADAKPVSIANYNHYRSLLVNNIKEFYNAEGGAAKPGFDMSALDKQRKESMSKPGDAENFAPKVPVSFTYKDIVAQPAAQAEEQPDANKKSLGVNFTATGYSAVIIGFESPKEAKAYIYSATSDFNDNIKFTIEKDNKSNTYLLKIGPVSDEVGANRLCDLLSPQNLTCDVIK